MGVLGQCFFYLRSSASAAATASLPISFPMRSASSVACVDICEHHQRKRSHHLWHPPPTSAASAAHARPAATALLRSGTTATEAMMPGDAARGRAASSRGLPAAAAAAAAARPGQQRASSTTSRAPTPRTMRCGSTSRQVAPAPVAMPHSKVRTEWPAMATAATHPLEEQLVPEPR